MTTALLCVFLSQTAQLKVGNQYLCQMVEVSSPTELRARIGGSRHPVRLVLAGLKPAPKATWAFEAGKKFLGGWMTAGASPLSFRILKVGKAVFFGDLYYESRNLHGSRDLEVRHLPLSRFLLGNGYAQVTNLDPIRARIQAAAKESGNGMWTKEVPDSHLSSTFDGAVEKVITPTMFQIRTFWDSTWNTSPVRVRLFGVISPNRNSETYKEAMSYAQRLDGELKIDVGLGTLNSHGSTTFGVYSMGKDGILNCSINYLVFNPDGLEIGMREEVHDYAEELLFLGFAKIDPKAKPIPEAWILAEARAKNAARGVWARSGR